MAGLEAEGLQKLVALMYRHLVQPLQDPPPREARLRKVQEVVGTRDLYLCLLHPERRVAGAGLEDRGGRSGIGLGFGT